MAWYVLKFSGYRLTSRGDELHVQCGLLTRVSATVPRRRIQVISVHRGWIARICGLASIRLETSGGGMGGEAEDASQTIGRRWFVPILRDSDLNRVLRSIDPELSWDLSAIDWVPLARNAGWRMIRAIWITTALLLGIVGVIAWFLDWRWMAWGGSIATVFLVMGTMLAWRRARSRKFAMGQVLFASWWFVNPEDLHWVSREDSIGIAARIAVRSALEHGVHCDRHSGCGDCGSRTPDRLPRFPGCAAGIRNVKEFASFPCVRLRTARRRSKSPACCGKAKVPCYILEHRFARVPFCVRG